MKVSLTRRAEKNYLAIREYIADEWGEKVAQAFEQKTVDFLDILKDFPEIGTVEVIENQIRGFQLTKHTKLFYRIKGSHVIILTFFDVRQDPKKKLL